MEARIDGCDAAPAVLFAAVACATYSLFAHSGGRAVGLTDRFAVGVGPVLCTSFAVSLFMSWFAHACGVTSVLWERLWVRVRHNWRHHAVRSYLESAFWLTSILCTERVLTSTPVWTQAVVGSAAGSVVIAVPIILRRMLSGRLRPSVDLVLVNVEDVPCRTQAALRKDVVSLLNTLLLVWFLSFIGFCMLRDCPVGDCAGRHAMSALATVAVCGVTLVLTGDVLATNEGTTVVGTLILDRFLSTSRNWGAHPARSFAELAIWALAVWTSWDPTGGAGALCGMQLSAIVGVFTVLLSHVRLEVRLERIPRVSTLRALPDDVLARSLLWLDVDGLRAGMRACRAWRRAAVTSAPVAARLRQRVLVLGGGDGGEPHDAVEQYDVMTRRWTTLSTDSAPPTGGDAGLRLRLRCAKGSMAAVRARDSVYVFGGFADRPLCDAEAFGLRSRAWRALPAMGAQRSRAGVARCQDSIYVMGGYDGAAPLRSAERFDVGAEAWHNVPDMIEPRGAPAAVELGGCIYVIGGWNGDAVSHPHAALRSVERFDPRTGSWQAVRSMAHSRSTPSAAVLYGHIYVLGGYAGGRPPDGPAGGCRLQSVERYDPRRDEWEEVAAMRCGRSGEAAVAVDGRILAIGGWDGREYLDHVEEYCPATNRWSPLPSLRLRRRDPAAVAYVAVATGRDT